MARAVDERALPEQVLDLLRERFTFQQGDAHLFLAYLVPGADGAIEAGKRRVNWVWYRRLASDRLRSLFVARDGTRATGRCRPARCATTTARSSRRRSPRSSTRHPHRSRRRWDLAVERMAVGRAVLLGDAACLVRPHTAAGVAKAADDAVGLAQALREVGHGRGFDAALAGWDARQRRERGDRRARHCAGRPPDGRGLNVGRPRVGGPAQRLARRIEPRSTLARPPSSSGSSGWPRAAAGAPCAASNAASSQARHPRQYGSRLHCALAVETAAPVRTPAVAVRGSPCAIAYSSRLRAIVCVLGG